jgi:hypothetical protein
MKIRRLAVASVLFTASLLAADFTGTWTGVVNAGNGPAPLPFVVHIKQDGDTISGRMDGIGGSPDVEIHNGKVNGNTITFEGVRQINNQDVKFNYIGTLNGDKLDFQILRAAGGNPLASSTTRLTPAF